MVVLLPELARWQYFIQQIAEIFWIGEKAIAEVITQGGQQQNEQRFPEAKDNQGNGQQQANQCTGPSWAVTLENLPEALPEAFHVQRSTRIATGSTRLTLIKTWATAIPV